MERFRGNTSSMERVNILCTQISQLEQARNTQLSADSYERGDGTVRDSSKWGLVEAIDARLKDLYQELALLNGSSSNTFRKEEKTAELHSGAKRRNYVLKSEDGLFNEQQNRRRWSGESNRSSMELDSSINEGENPAQGSQNAATESSPETDTLLLQEIAMNRNKQPGSFRGQNYERYSIKRDTRFVERDPATYLKMQMDFKDKTSFLDSSKAQIQAMQKNAESKQQETVTQSIKKVSFQEHVEEVSPVAVPNPRKARSQWSQQNRNVLAKSVPNFIDLKKENTKPHSPPQRSGPSLKRPGVAFQFNSPTTKSHHQAAAAGTDQKNKRRGRNVAKSIASVNELKGISAQAIKAGERDKDRPILSPIQASKTANINAKPFLRKGTGNGGANNKSTVSPYGNLSKQSDDSYKTPNRGDGPKNAKKSVAGYATDMGVGKKPSSSAIPSTSIHRPVTDAYRRAGGSSSQKADGTRPRDNGDEANQANGIWKKRLFS